GVKLALDPAYDPMAYRARNPYALQRVVDDYLLRVVRVPPIDIVSVSAAPVHADEDFQFLRGAALPLDGLNHDGLLSPRSVPVHSFLGSLHPASTRMASKMSSATPNEPCTRNVTVMCPWGAKS